MRTGAELGVLGAAGLMLSLACGGGGGGGSAGGDAGGVDGGGTRPDEPHEVTDGGPTPADGGATHVDAGPSMPAEAEPTDPGEVSGEATEVVIGPEGGSVVSTDGVLFMVVPAGALAEDTTIRVEPISNTAWGGIGDAYRLSPDGQEFDEPVELHFNYSEKDVEGTTAEAVRIAYQDEDGLWRALKEADVDVDQQQISVTTTHFSDWARVASLRILPSYSTIEVNEHIELVVETCLADDTSASSDPVAFLSGCRPIADADGVGLEDWAANDVPDGNDSVGRVVGDTANATYTAPMNPPTENPVRVTASVIGHSSTVLTARVLVTFGGVRAEVWRGTVTQEINFGDADGSFHEMLTADVVYMGSNGEFGGILMLTEGHYEAEYLAVNNVYEGGCMHEESESGDFPESGSGSLEFFGDPFGGESTYNLELTIDEYYDGTTNCNPMHMVSELMDDGFVLGVDTGPRPWDPTLSIVDDDFDEPHNGGTKRVTVHLVKD